MMIAMIDYCKCGGEIFESKTLSRCLRCRKSTVREVDAKIYYKSKNNIKEDDENGFASQDQERTVQ